MSTDIVERPYVSQYATETVGVIINVQGAVADPDSDLVSATMTNEGNNVVVFTRSATRLDVGKYGVTLSSSDTAEPGIYAVRFSYNIGGVADSYTLHIEIGQPSPNYDALSPEMKAIVEEVWVKFADLYDSPFGGPHLQVYIQTNFGRNRLAQLLKQAIGRLNTIAQPYSTYAIDQPFPFAQWGPLLVQALYVEALKHLQRSYVEQPEVVLGSAISRTDRRDYMDRWGVILGEEQTDLERQMKSFKMANMGLGGGSVLVSGGIFGRGYAGWGATPGIAAARGYFTARYY